MTSITLPVAQATILLYLARQELHQLESSGETKEIYTKDGNSYYGAGLLSIIVSKLEGVVTQA